MNKAPVVRTRNPKSETRATILAKAYDMYVKRELEHGDERLSAVLDELGYTTGAGYQIWANQAEFRADLQVYIAENIEYANPDRIADDIAAVAATAESWEEYLLGVGDLYAENMIGDEAFYLSLRFFGMAEDRPEPITEALRDAYERSRWQAEERFELAMSGVGVRMKEPLRPADMAVALTALMEGYSLRASVQPDQALAKLKLGNTEHYAFSYGFLAIVQGFTERVRD